MNILKDWKMLMIRKEIVKNLKTLGRDHVDTKTCVGLWRKINKASP